MREIILNQTIDSAYNMIDSNLVELKSAIIGLCIDIERYFKIAFNVSLNKEIDEKDFRRILYVYPQFGQLSIEQFNRFIILYVNIRGINAHLYLSKSIFLDEDLKDFMYSVFKPEYNIEIDKKLTVYGCVAVLGFLAQKYMIWPFVTSFFRNDYFKEIEKGNKMNDFQIQQQKILNIICGIGKPLSQEAERVGNIDSVYLNDTLKRTLTLVFFDLEKVLTPIITCRYRTVNIGQMLRRDPLFNEDVINDIVKLRNCWFHGFFLGDVVDCKDGSFAFTFEFACKVLNEIVDVGAKNVLKYGLVINDISYFATSLYYFYVLRLVELSFKILDNRLLTEEKLDGRLNNMDKSFERLTLVNPSYFDALSKLVGSNVIRWNISGSKFLDFIPRKFNSSNLSILKLHCDNGFTIGKYKTNRTDIVLVSIELEKSYLNLVNGLDLRSIKGKEIRKYSKFITLKETSI